MYEEDEFLLLSGIQHFEFCRRQWALIHIEQLWKENILTAEGRQDHKRVHDESISDYRKECIVKRGLAVKSAELGITGECDAVEFTKSDEGIHLYKKTGCWIVIPVEYKHGRKKADDCDVLQVVAQAMCLEEMFCCHIDYGYIFYFETRRREKIDISVELREKVKKTFEEMHGYYSKGYTPVVKRKKQCDSCSMIGWCEPQFKDAKTKSVMEYMRSYLKGD